MIVRGRNQSVDLSSLSFYELKKVMGEYEKQLGNYPADWASFAEYVIANYDGEFYGGIYSPDV
jgi:hypothetical protein